MFRRFLSVYLFLACSAVVVPLIAQEAAASDGVRTQESEYETCLTLTRREPQKAFESALAWRDSGGGFPARHCVALALVAMKKYNHAAMTLEELAEDMQSSGSELLVPVLMQAANVWLLGENYGRAEAMATAGLTIDPENIDLLIDRSRIYAKVGEYQKAFDDLDIALKLNPARSDALTFRAAAWRHLGDNARALEDVELALSLNPDLPDALIERGILYQTAGKPDLARKDWLQVLELATNTPAGDEARRHLEALDVNKDK
ncbi:hypothetical protein [uncultured Sneathiella sp.]|jgi:tetratricopeptide (TPR) repeat protein|uniref:hypothetical protein n=1 Tax=uncultured Sneathiella sp. TaxID=879315 RepID=UPI0030D77F2B|tara:strand:+ start:29919 stop:30701 length:783 start_codon:yes stop_codon:yes gene_type:complete